MRIALLTQFFPPETFAGANRVAAMAAGLAEVGELHIVAPEPSYPDPEAYAGAPAPQLPAGATLTRVPPMPQSRGSWARRAAAEAGLAARVSRAARRPRPDVFVTSSPSMFLGPAALLTASASRAPLVWDLRDLTWEYGKDDDVVSGVLARTAIAALGRVMWLTARRARVVTCATEGLGTAIRERLPGARVEVVPNGMDPSLLASFDPAPPRPGERLRMLYAGLVGHAQGLDVLLDVAQRAPEIELTIAGDGPRLADLEKQARAAGLANLRFTGYVRPQELAALYHDADVLFAQLQRSELHRATAAPSKLLEYMAAGRPIVYGGEGSAAELVERACAGVVVPPGDAAAVLQALGTLTPERRASLGRIARAYAEAMPTRLDEMRRLAGIVAGLA